MPLDPKLKELLDQPADPNAKPIEEIPIEEIRHQFNEEIAAIDKPGPEMKDIQDRAVDVGDAEIPVRWYTPSTLSAPSGNPVLVFFHGGGWIQGNIETHDSMCRVLAHDGRCLVCSVDYRLAPENKFPVPLNDSYAATKWVYQNASEFGAGPGKLAVGGDSAGGNLAAAISLKARDEGSMSIAFQLLLYPVMDLASDTESKRQFSKGYWLDTLAFLIRSYVASEEDKTDPLASPLRAKNFSGLPSSYIVTAGHDPLRDEGKAYATRLQEAGVAAKYECFESMIHGFISIRSIVDEGEKALQACATSLREAFR